MENDHVDGRKRLSAFGSQMASEFVSIGRLYARNHRRTTLWVTYVASSTVPAPAYLAASVGSPLAGSNSSDRRNR